jgi:glycosyltransferase involved in cell wall biosynthesis
MYDISAILTCHAEGWLTHATKRSVEAAVAHAEKAGLNVEWLIVCDRPTADMLEYLSAHMPANARLETVDVGDPGCARNEAMALVSGKYLSFIDGDDIWSANWLSEAYRFAERYSKQCVVHCDLKVFFEREQFMAYNIDQESQEFKIDGLFEHNFWNPSCLALREVFLEHPYAKSDLANGLGYEDWYWNYEIVAAGILHKVAPGTVHGIRIKTWRPSQEGSSNALNCVTMPTKFFDLAFQTARAKS